MLSESYGWHIEKLVKDLLGVEKKYDAVRFLGISIGGVVLVSQALISYKRAKAMDDTAKAQAKATEEQAKANENTEKGQRQERLKNAIEHLGHEKVSVRLGGAYELFHLAHDTEEKNQRQSILDILCAHIRQTTSVKKYQEDPQYKSKPSEEIQSLLTLLFVQDHDVFKGLHINLQGSWLNGAELGKARLETADLARAYLQGAWLSAAGLQGSILTGAQLQEATLSEAKLQGARLGFAALQGSDLGGAQLQGSWLLGIELRGAGLQNAQLQGADLQNAQLQGAALYDVCLQGAVLVEAELHGVSANAHFNYFSFETNIGNRIGEESDLSGVTFEGGLSEEDMDSLVEGLSDYDAEKLRRDLIQHIDKPASHELPEKSSAKTGSYTEEDAEQWIAEYKKAVPSNSGEDNS